MKLLKNVLQQTEGLNQAKGRLGSHGGLPWRLRQGFLCKWFIEDICKGVEEAGLGNRESSTRGESRQSSVWSSRNMLEGKLLYSCPNLKQRNWLAYSPLVHQEILRGMADEGWKFQDPWISRFRLSALSCPRTVLLGWTESTGCWKQKHTKARKCVCVWTRTCGEIGTEETETPTQERRKEIPRIMVKGDPKKTAMQTVQTAGVDQETGRKLFKK